MLIAKLHPDEVDIDTLVVRRMLAEQCPQWADLALRPVARAGTDNAMIRLGDDLVLRMPRIESAVGGVVKEQRFAARLAGELPVAIPVPLLVGQPTADYPWPWSVSRWLPGTNPACGSASDQLALDLAGFVRVLHAIDTAGERREGPLDWYRCGPFGAVRDDVTEVIDQSAGLLDVDLVRAAWADVREVTEGDGAEVWIHADIQPGNVLVADGRLSAVIDFGGLAIGDPSVDLIVAWNLLDAATRDTFRTALQVDDETWARGRAWALAIGLVALPYYVATNPPLAEVSRYQIAQVLADWQRSQPH